MRYIGKTWAEKVGAIILLISSAVLVYVLMYGVLTYFGVIEPEPPEPQARKEWPNQFPPAEP
jgi:hypothetical protein